MNSKKNTAPADLTDSGQNAGIQLPPALQQMLLKLQLERKSLLREKKISDENVRAYIAHHIYPHLLEAVEALGTGLTETYIVASQSLTETSRLRDAMRRREESSGEDGVIEVAETDLEALREALAALGLLLVAKLPNDEETQLAFNRVHDAFVEVAGDGASEDDEDDEDDEDEDDDDDEDDDEDGDGGDEDGDDDDTSGSGEVIS